MSDPTYLLAKYVANPKRMEPRNIGVILWSRGGLAIRFMEPEEAKFVDDKKMYSRWINFWTKTCDEGALQTQDGKTVTARSKAFLDALAETQRGNYLLYEGGFILDDVRAKEREQAADYLYRELVAIPGKASDDVPQRDSFEARCDALFEEAGVADRDEFISGYSLELDAEGVKAPFRFDYAWENGRLAALFLRVNLAMQPSTASAAFMFEHAQKNPKAKSAERYSLVTGDSVITDKKNESADRAAARERLLKTLSTVIRVSDTESFKSAVGRLAI